MGCNRLFVEHLAILYTERVYFSILLDFVFIFGCLAFVLIELIETHRIHIKSD